MNRHAHTGVRQRAAALGLAFAASALLACGPEPRRPLETAVSVRAALVTGTDVELVRYRLQPVDCTNRALVGYPIEDQIMPGAPAELAQSPLDPDARHQFADLFKLVDAGCYDVTVLPITAEGAPSTVCAPAFAYGVEVVDGETAEVLLIMQCQGEDPGAAEVIAAFNREPEILQARFTGESFVCGEPAELCVESRDVEGDPIEHVLLVLGDAACTIAPLAPQGTDAQAGIQQCFSVDCAQTGRVELGLRVYDLVTEDDRLVRIEDWLTNAGYPSNSHAVLDLFAHFGGTAYYPDADADGHGAAVSEAVVACAPPEAHATSGSDCDDANAAVHPGAEEICGDGIDGDCDGTDSACVCAASAPLDLVLLHDLAGSFGEVLPNVRALVPELHASVSACSESAAFGVASFVDKPFAPYGGPSDYSYRFEQALSPELATLQATLDGLQVHSDNDGSAAQLTGLLHAASSDELAWAPGSRRVIVLLTDAQNHAAGDCPLSACTQGANDGDDLMSEFEDYPSHAQVASALEALGAEVVFAVTSDQLPHYTSLLEALGTPGKVVELSAGGDDLIEVVLEGIDCDCD